LIILHLSDLHIDDKYSWDDAQRNIPSLGASINTALEKASDCHARQFVPDVLLITGDFINSAPPILFETAASTGFNKSYEIINDFQNLSYLSKLSRIIVTPGNHDFSRDSEADKSYRLFKDKLKQLFPSSPQTTNVSSELQTNISFFNVDHEYIENANRNYLIIGLNSHNIVEQSELGFFSRDQLQLFQNLHGHYNNLCEQEAKQLITFVAFHHHLAPVTFVDRQALGKKSKYSATVDARQAINDFLKCNVSAIFHGHKHQPSCIRFEDMDYADKPLPIISAGSVCGPVGNRGAVNKNTFMLYEICNDLLRIHYFITNDNNEYQFELTKSYSCHLSNVRDQQKCDYHANSSVPKNTRFETIPTISQRSNLYYLFLNVWDCGEARTEIENFINKEQIKNNFKSLKICGMYDLYGKYDTLLKYRIDSREEAEDFKEALEKAIGPTQFTDTVVPKNNMWDVTITKEQPNFFNNRTAIPICEVETFRESHWNHVFLEVILFGNLKPEFFLTSIKEKIVNEKLDTSIFTSVNIAGVDSVVFEMIIPCYQFPLLSQFSRFIEGIIANSAIDKSTHIVYHNDERCA